MSNLLKNIPDNLEKKLFEEYTEIKRRFHLSDSGPSQLNGGRFSEVVLRIFQHLLGDTISDFGHEIKPNEKTKILNKIENDNKIDEHIRQKVSVLVRLMLDFRNNRDIAHLGGFKANNIDAQFVLSCANWILAEFIRVYGNYTLPEAQKIIDSMSIPAYPVIFNIEGDDFLTRTDLSAGEEVLVFLSAQKRNFDFLFMKTKDTNQSRFKKTLSKLEKDKKIVCKNNFYHILPNGIKIVQNKNLLNTN